MSPLWDSSLVIYLCFNPHPVFKSYHWLMAEKKFPHDIWIQHEFSRCKNLKRTFASLIRESALSMCITSPTAAFQCRVHLFNFCPCRHWWLWIFSPRGEHKAPISQSRSVTRAETRDESVTNLVIYSLTSRTLHTIMFSLLFHMLLTQMMYYIVITLFILRCAPSQVDMMEYRLYLPSQIKKIIYMLFGGNFIILA